MKAYLMMIDAVVPALAVTAFVIGIVDYIGA